MGERVVEWSDLPKELWSPIGKSLDTRLDVLRFRSVCSSWRSSIPSFQDNSSCFPLKFPHPFDPSPPPTYLCQSTLYRLQPLNPSTSAATSSPSSSRNKGCLIKVEESDSGKLRLLDPLSNLRIGSSPLNPKTLNLLNFRMVELTKAYTLRFEFVIPGAETIRKYFLSDSSVPGVNKVMMFPNSARTNAEGCAVLVIFLDGKLGFAKYGEEQVTLVDDRRFEYDDIIVYRGQLYVVDSMGIVFWIECSSLKLVPFLPPLCGLGSRKHLVESCGALYVVDRYLDRERRRMEIGHYYVRGRDRPKTVDFKVYKMDEEWAQWVLVKSLGDRAFVLGTDCTFSVSTKEFVGCKGNSIYFIDQEESRVFNLEDRRIDDLAFSPESFSSFLASPNLA